MSCRSNLNPEISVYDDGNFDARNCEKLLSDLRTQNVENIIIAHLNINSLRNKFDALVHIINGNVDILVVVETKLDQTFPENQFRINGFKKPYRRDRTANGGGIMIFVREDIPSLEKKNHTLPHNVEAIFVEKTYPQLQARRFYNYET